MKVSPSTGKRLHQPKGERDALMALPQYVDDAVIEPQTECLPSVNRATRWQDLLARSADLINRLIS